ncbi:hypothetical protein [Brevibacterium sp. UCMA 11754]|uniref:hypothetical protein n=1 Tax=Brevibacterium sp. UCMA 11754 TaxID=2749198 RepID=UPI001F1A24E7|nr:hypothetical protein [Brevibacterium sp. UCMA 11754]MCF2570785.1 hypothetical protein [Brevibacterium sp. UCMA 11754]
MEQEREISVEATWFQSKARAFFVLSPVTRAALSSMRDSRLEAARRIDAKKSIQALMRSFSGFEDHVSNV